MRFITAEKIHDGRNWMEPTVLELNQEGRILACHPRESIPVEKVEVFNGMICPGFVNVHCHLELSHLKNQIPEGTGLIDFLTRITQNSRQATKQEKETALRLAISSMKANGIVALGDIANTADTVGVRQTAGMHIHTFVEALGFIPETAKNRFLAAEATFQQYVNQSQAFGEYQLRQSIVPHAPYSNSKALFSYIDQHNSTSIISIHNEESKEENKFFKNKTGQILDFFQSFPMNISFFNPSGKSSLQTYLPWLASTHPLILVHNTYMEAEDILFLKHLKRNIFLCLCPNANWFIERQLPPIPDFQKAGIEICLGTDSLASNHELSILSEMHRIKKSFPEISWETLLRWGTWNGSLALQLENWVGEIKEGKRPGLLHIWGEDFQEMEVLY